MSINATELVGKLNFVLSSRRFKAKGYIEDYPALPKTSSEEEDIVADMMFAFVKKLFVGCKVRVNTNSYSLRLDGQIHRKANKLRDIYSNDSEWKNWFEQHHSSIYRTMRENRQTFQNGSMVEKRIVDGKIFLYVPKKPNRIYGYVNHGLLEFCKWLELEYQKDVHLSSIYDEAMRLMENEIKRREEERRERIARELRQYKESIMKQLFKPIAPMQESEKAIERLFAHKFSQWARENGKVPEYAVEAGPEQMVTRDLRVKIMAQPGSEETGWIALPPFEGYPDPEGYEMQGWGKVTNIDMTSDRSRQGQAPIVVQEYLYTEFHLDYWKHLIPEGHEEILEASTRIWAEAQVEIEPWLEQERIRKAAEEAERKAAEEARQRAIEEERRLREEQIRRDMEEARRREEAEQARVREAAQRIREQMAAEAEAERSAAEDEPREEPDIEVVQPEPNPSLTAALRNQFNAEPERATAQGLYRNMRAIPLERYVAINARGERRFASAQRAAEHLGLTGVVTIRDYHAPHNQVEEFTVSREDELPF